MRKASKALRSGGKVIAVIALGATVTFIRNEARYEWHRYWGNSAANPNEELRARDVKPDGEDEKHTNSGDTTLENLKRTISRRILTKFSAQKMLKGLVGIDAYGY